MLYSCFDLFISWGNNRFFISYTFCVTSWLNLWYKLITRWIGMHHFLLLINFKEKSFQGNSCNLILPKSNTLGLLFSFSPITWRVPFGANASASSMAPPSDMKFSFNTSEWSDLFFLMALASLSRLDLKFDKRIRRWSHRSFSTAPLQLFKQRQKTRPIKLCTQKDIEQQQLFILISTRLGQIPSYTCFLDFNWVCNNSICSLLIKETEHFTPSLLSTSLFMCHNTICGR